MVNWSNTSLIHTDVSLENFRKALRLSRLITVREPKNIKKIIFFRGFVLGSDPDPDPDPE
jgi:hypothetical protein